MIERVRTLVRYPEQFRVALIALGAAGLILLVNYQMSAWATAGVAGEIAGGTDARTALHGLQSALFHRFLFSLALSIPVAAAIGILYSFAFAGPIYRFETYFKGLRSGRWDARCSLRKNDDMQDLCTTINEALDQFREVLAKNQETIADVELLLHGGALAGAEEMPEELKKLQGRIAELKAIHAQRFPGPSLGTSQSPCRVVSTT
jgi:methyl-accepting chemotaxis protein